MVGHSVAGNVFILRERLEVVVWGRMRELSSDCFWRMMPLWESKGIFEMCSCVWVKLSFGVLTDGIILGYYDI